ncbi:hypothetical protein CHUAL_001111 [Chamberlinius hualienensis]
MKFTQGIFVIRDRTDSQLIWAKQRASILWLISKANNNKVPDDLKEPYYKDHEDQDQLKPVIVHALATAELYCLALGNIYADPNYHNLNHWGVIQALARKGVYVAEPSDVALTETVLLQTSPIRMSAHMAVIEAIMALYLKETITVERIVLAVKRFLPAGPIELPADIEDALVYWINKVCVRMKHRIEDEMRIATSEVQKTQNETKEVTEASAAKDVNSSGDKSNNIADKVAPPLSLLQDLSDLSNGCCLNALISYYCPHIFRWQSICLNSPMSMADSLHNLQLVQRFCKEHLPYDPCFLTLEDLVYLHSSVTQNILVLLAELFFLFEIRPAKCVFNSRQDVSLAQSEIRPAGLPNRNGHNESGLVSSATKRSFQQPVSPIPDLRNSVSNSYYTSIPDLNRISPKGSGPAIREPLLPRRHSQHERMQERSKRFSFNDGPKVVSPNVPVSPVTTSIRRSHSVHDMDKNGVGEAVQSYNDNEAESAYYSTSPVARKQLDEQVAYESTSELYLRPLPCGDGEQLMPAVIKPHKEKNNRESKPEELGEFPVHRTGKSNSQHRDFNNMKDNGYQQRQSSPEKYINYNLRNLSHEMEAPSYMEIKPDSRSYDYQDNRHLEESLMKQPYILSSNDGMSMKEGLESFGSTESGVVLENLPRKDMSTTSFAQLSKLRENQKGINFVYMQHERDGKGKGDTVGRSDKKTSFASLPNQTTWQQVNNSSQDHLNQSSQEAPLVSQLVDVRLKLEEKRRNIEAEKRKAESLKDQAREQIGKTAFLQVVSKGKPSGREEPDEEEQLDLEESLIESRSGVVEPERFTDNRELSMGGSRLSSDGGEKTYGEYNRSIEHLTSSLSDLQSDIQRLTLQQEKIQHLMKNGIPQQVAEPPNQFYLHDQQQQQQQPPPIQQSMWSNRSSSSQDYGYPQQIPRSHSREQLYQPLQRTQSREQLMGGMVNPTMSHPMGHWGGNETMMNQSPYSMGPLFAQQTYVEQPGFNLHSQPHFIPMYGNAPMMPAGDSYGANYAPYQPMSMMIDPHRPPSTTPMHMDVSGMSLGGPTSSHSQNQITFHRSIQQPPRPPSRPSSAPANSNPVVTGPSLTMKSTPVMAPVDSYMEPQSVHFLDTSDGFDDDHYRLNQEVEDAMGDLRGGSSSLENVVSGTATYRVREPLSPTRPVLGKTFRVTKNKLPSPPPRESRISPVETVSIQPEEEMEEVEEAVANDKGFFVPFNGDSQPRKPKPAFNNAKKVPKVLQKTEPRNYDQLDATSSSTFSSPEKRVHKLSPPVAPRTVGKPVFEPTANESYQFHMDKDIQEVEEQFRSVISDAEKSLSSSKHDSAVGFQISDDSKDEADLTEEEMARRKERILLNVIRRKEQQEMLRQRKELEAAKRREKEQRQAILEQYRQRKAAMEEQENDRDSSRTATLPKPKVKPGLKQRPKSLHESALSGHEERQVERMTRASGTRGSQSNISSRATPPRRAPSPGQSTYDRHPPSPISYQCPPGGLPPGLVGRRPAGGPGSTMFNDTASDSCSTASSTAVEYTGPKLFKQPTAKSNRGIIVNAINTVLAGAVNEDVKRHVLDEIQMSESKHFLILFRDAGCQFRGLYSYSPEKEEVIKLFGTGPKQVNERMIDKFYKYNCGGRNFTHIQTKHLTVTMDAFTIHNSLWQGKKVVQGRRDL